LKARTRARLDSTQWEGRSYLLTRLFPILFVASSAITAAVLASDASVVWLVAGPLGAGVLIIAITTVATRTSGWFTSWTARTWRWRHGEPDSEQLRRLRNVEPVIKRGTYYTYGPSHPTERGKTPAAGRFNGPGEEAPLYAISSPRAMWENFAASGGTALPHQVRPQRVWTLDVHDLPVIDLTDPSVQRRMGISAKLLTSADWTASRWISNAIRGRRDVGGLIAPLAVAPEESVIAIFQPWIASHVAVTAVHEEVPPADLMQREVASSGAPDERLSSKQPAAFAEIMAVLEESLPQASAFAWFGNPNPALGGRTPLEVVERGDVESVRRAAHSLAAGVAF
jgi:RES domain-containing protein